MRVFGWPMALLCLGCSPEYKLGAGTGVVVPLTTTDDGPEPMTQGDDDDDSASGDDDDDDAPGDDDDGHVGDDDDAVGDDDDGPSVDTGGEPTDPDRPHDWVPPTFGTDDCPDGYRVQWTSSGLVAMSWDPPVYGSLEAPVEGDYDVYHLVAAESGPAQTNESFLLRLSSASNPTGQPLTGNCGDDFIVVDSDNVTTPVVGTTQYAGTFHLAGGYNLLEARHYCELYRAGSCPQHHDPGTPCDGTSVNSVHLEGDAVCLVPTL